MNLLSKLTKAERFGDEIRGHRVMVVKFEVKNKPYYIINGNPNCYFNFLPNYWEKIPLIPTIDEMKPIPFYLRPFVKRIIKDLEFSERFN